jgi:hypothetical protein
MRFAPGIILAVLVLAVPAAAQQYTSMEGDWWLDVTGDKGIVKLEFQEEQGSSFGVAGAGFSRGFATFWAVSDDSAQFLEFDFEGNITGTLQLEDLTNTDAKGTLEIVKGSVNSAYSKIKLKGTLTLDGGEPLKVSIKGGRLPMTPPAWTGRTHRAKLGGTGVKSSKYDVRLEHAPTLGFPFLLVTGEGSVEIDGEGKTDVVLGGVLLASPSGKLFGEFVFETSTGTVKGKIREKSAGPKLKLQARIADGARKVKVRAVLDILL